jgi:hypothetical protein
MACLPPIPERPAGRPETWTEYSARRVILGMHRQFADDLAAWLKSGPLPPFDPFDWLFRVNRIPQLPPVRRRLRTAWSCGRAPGHEHASFAEALRCRG